MQLAQPALSQYGNQLKDNYQSSLLNELVISKSSRKINPSLYKAVNLGAEPASENTIICIRSRQNGRSSFIRRVPEQYGSLKQ
jgi:hypothetical protein